MKQYELTIIVDPVLSGDDLNTTAKKYIDMITANNGTIVNVDEMGLRPLAYPIDKRASGVYYCIEFTLSGENILPKIELAMRRDDNIMRYLTIALDKFGVKYNEDRRAGKIGSSKKEKANKGKRGETTNEVVEAPAAPVAAGNDPELSDAAVAAAE